MLSDEMLEGLTVHVLEPLTLLRSGSEFASATLLKRGDVIEVNATDIEQNKNRVGESILAIADDPELQEFRYGRVLLGVGPWPEWEPVDRDDLESIATVQRSSRLINKSATVAVYAGDF